MALAAIMISSIVNTTRAASYIEPDHTSELFQLEKIPLPQHRTQQLGKSLVIIALRKHDASPANQLASARLLLLAMQLDPKNKRPYEISKSLASAKIPPATPQDLVIQCLAEAQKIQSLLIKPRAGAQANQLARLIKDACKMIQPETYGDKDVADWKDTLPAITAYKTTEKKVASLPVKPPTPPTQASKPVPPHTPKPAPTQKAKSQFHFTEQSLLMPVLIKQDNDELEAAGDEEAFVKQEEPTQFLGRIMLTLKPCDPNTNKTEFIKILQSGNSEPNLDATLKSLINKKHSNIASYQGLVKFTNGSFNNKQHLSLTGPLALMLEASLAKSALRDDLCILVDVDPNGKLSEPKNFWNLLANLRKANSGGRLIISDQSLDYMEQLLVFKESEFFTRWEVFSAAHIDQAIQAAIIEGNKELTQASEIFGKIQELAADQEVVQLAADHDIRDQLEKVTTMAPSHLSAKMLLLQGSGTRPTHLNKNTFRVELQPLIEEINSMLPEQANNIDVEKLISNYDPLQEKLDKLEPIVDRDEEELFQKIADLSTDIKKLASLTKRYERRNKSELSRKKVEECLKDMQALGESLIERIMALDQTEIENNAKSTTTEK